MKTLLSLTLALAALTAAPALAQVTASTPSDPCVLQPDERSLKTMLELRMIDPPPAPVLVDPSTGQRIGGCSLWRLQIDASGNVLGATFVRGVTPGDHRAQAQVWLRRLRFLRFSEGWSGLYLLRN